MGKSTTYNHWVAKAIPNNSFPGNYNLKLIESIEELETILSADAKYLSFDTETTGLDPTKCFIVGYSFSLDDPRTPVEKLDVSYFKYDMGKVNVLDIQAMIWLADTGMKFPSLKWSEEWFLGWRGASFEATLGTAENFYYLNPEDCYFYAATDALGTYLLFAPAYSFYKAAGVSGQLDVKFLYPLMKWENESLAVDRSMLVKYSEYLSEEINTVQDRIWKHAGYPFNIGSGKEKSEVLDRLGISTGERTARGEWRTGKYDIENALKGMEKTDPNYQFLKDLTEFNALRKQQSSYVDNIIEMLDASTIGDRLRFGYKTVMVPSGRLSAGGDSKNTYFSELNIQNQPKPHATDWYYLPIKTVEEHWGSLDSIRYNEDGTEKREFEFVKREITSLGVDSETRYTLTCILDWCFANKPFNIEGVQEYVIEGFKPDMNIRNAFIPDEGRYWVSIDYSAQELRIAALFSEEPAWVDAFKHYKDIHKQTACQLWGEENYTKDRRKMAKGANFGILYGQNEYNFADGWNIPLEEARDFMNLYKSRLPKLFRWIGSHQANSRKNGYVTTLFGRQIRTKYYNEHPDYNMRSYGNRLAVNAAIQGTGADILKLSTCKLWKSIFSNWDNRKHIKFCSTIHDEINYQIPKQEVTKIVPILVKTMRLQMPNWPFAMDVGLDIGNRWGTTFSFDYDKDTGEILGPKGDPYTPKPKEEVKQEVEEIKPVVEVPEEPLEITFNL